MARPRAVLVDSSQFLTLLYNTQMDCLDQGDTILAALHEMGARLDTMTTTVQDLKDKFTAITTAVDSLETTNTTAFKAQSDLTAAALQKVGDLQAQLGLSATQITADNTQIQTLQDAATAAALAQQKDIDDLGTAASSVLDHISSLNPQSATPPVAAPPATVPTDPGTAPTGSTGATSTSPSGAVTDAGGVIQPTGNTPNGP